MIITLYIFQLMNIGYFSTVGGKNFLIAGVIFMLVQSGLLISLSLYKMGKKNQDCFEISLLEQGINPLDDVASTGLRVLPTPEAIAVGQQQLALEPNHVLNQTKDVGVSHHDNIELSKVALLDDKRTPSSVSPGQDRLLKQIQEVI
jgi:hypothetical protein